MAPFPDALLFPEAARVGRSMHERVINLSKRCEAMLGLDYAKGERAYLRQATAGRIFVSASPTDTMMFPISHPRSGEARYRWELSTTDDDVKLGFLVDESVSTT
jgi:hypothetical protein